MKLLIFIIGAFIGINGAVYAYSGVFEPLGIDRPMMILKEPVDINEPIRTGGLKIDAYQFESADLQGSKYQLQPAIFIKE